MPNNNQYQSPAQPNQLSFNPTQAEGQKDSPNIKAQPLQQGAGPSENEDEYSNGYEDSEVSNSQRRPVAQRPVNNNRQAQAQTQPQEVTRQPSVSQPQYRRQPSNTRNTNQVPESSSNTRHPQRSSDEPADTNLFEFVPTSQNGEQGANYNAPNISSSIGQSEPYNNMDGHSSDQQMFADPNMLHSGSNHDYGPNNAVKPDSHPITRSLQSDPTQAKYNQPPDELIRSVAGHHPKGLKTKPLEDRNDQMLQKMPSTVQQDNFIRNDDKLPMHSDPTTNFSSNPYEPRGDPFYDKSSHINTPLGTQPKRQVNEKQGLWPNSTFEPRIDPHMESADQQSSRRLHPEVTIPYI